jgi:hypothetical protein
MDAKMSVDGYMDKLAQNTVDSKEFNNYTAQTSNYVNPDLNKLRNHYKSTDNLINRANDFD